MTEIGVIPDNWEIRPLGDEIERLEAGVSVNSVDEARALYSHDESILKTSAVKDGHFLEGECKKIAPKDIGRAKLNPHANTIIISRMNTPDLVGESGYVGKDYPNLFLPDRLWSTRFRAGSKTDVKWLSYLLSSAENKRRIKGAATGTSGSMKNISKGALLALPIPFPNPKEQSAIAAALGDVDALILALDQLIVKKKDIKQAVMQELLTGKNRLPGFSHQQWTQKRLGDLGAFRGGNGFPTRYQGQGDGDYPFFKVSDMNNEGNSIFMVNSNNWISESVRNQLGITYFPRNSIVFAKIGAAIFLERKKILYQGSCIDNNMMCFVPQTSVAQYRFMHYLFLSVPFGRFVSTTALPSLSGPELAELEFRVPPPQEQEAIASVLSDIDTDITTLEVKLSKTREIKLGMIQELLTGKTRLI